MVERLIRTLTDQCAHRHRLETPQHAGRVIGDRIRFYNSRRPHQALRMTAPAEAYALAASPGQKSLHHYNFARAGSQGCGVAAMRNRAPTSMPAAKSSTIGSPVLIFEFLHIVILLRKCNCPRNGVLALHH